MISFCEIFSSSGRRKLFLPLLLLNNFQVQIPPNLCVLSTFYLGLYNTKTEITMLRGHRSDFSRNFPWAAVSTSVTEDCKNTSHCASGQLCNVLSRGEIPSSLQLVSSYALEPRTDMPCNFLT